MREELENPVSHFIIDLIERKTGAKDPVVREYLEKAMQITLDHHTCLSLPSDPDLEQKLVQHPAIGGPAENCPFILFDNKLYLNRYFHMEKEIALMLFDRHEKQILEPGPDLKTELDRAFDEKNYQQKLAAFMAMTRKLTIISGGPGTGKTSTVVKILLLAKKLESGLKIKLAAPTGKAARRLRETLEDVETKDFSKPEVLTVHRLLGARLRNQVWKHGQENKLEADMLIIDEASMIDLSLMHHLLSAIPDHARLILIGDPEQLPSVEAGNVLSDLCYGDQGFSEGFKQKAEKIIGEFDAPLKSALPDTICHLEKSHRFSINSGIGRLSSALRNRSMDGYLSDEKVNFEFSERKNLTTLLTDHWKEYLGLLSVPEKDMELLSKTFQSVAIICSRRTGTSGSARINDEMESLLEDRDIKEPGQEFYHGRPIIITENDYRTGLFNGDTGICFKDEKTEDFVIKFDGIDKPIPELEIPKHETCFAITVHKAQGSEFDKVLFVLGRDGARDNPNLINLEMVYTAVTRAKREITIFSDKETWDKAISRAADRTGGIKEQIARIKKEKENHDK